MYTKFNTQKKKYNNNNNSYFMIATEMSIVHIFLRQYYFFACMNIIGLEQFGKPEKYIQGLEI